MFADFCRSYSVRKKYKTLMLVDPKRYGNLQIQKRQNQKTEEKLKITKPLLN